MTCYVTITSGAGVATSLATVRGLAPAGSTEGLCLAADLRTGIGRQGMMTEQEKWALINRLDQELLKGGVMLSEWSVFQIKDADIAYTSGANLAAILTALAGAESHLRLEYGEGKRHRLVELIDQADIEEDLRQDLHCLRRFRNRWVHVADPADDETLLEDPTAHEEQLEEMATLAIRSLRRTIYTEQWL